MGLPRVRFTVRRMMAVVVVMAMVMGAAEWLRRRSVSFQLRAKMFAQQISDAYMAEQNYRAHHRSNRPGTAFYYDGRTTAAYYQLVEHYDAMRVKYEQASASPWWFVGTDLAEPDWPKGVPRPLVGPDPPPEEP